MFGDWVDVETSVYQRSTSSPEIWYVNGLASITDSRVWPSAGPATGAAAGSDLVGVVESARGEAADALARTPEMLPVLAQAGVVDAGGSGYLLLLDAFLLVLDGRPLPEPSGVDAPDLTALDGALSSGSGHDGAEGEHALPGFHGGGGGSGRPHR